MFGTGHFGVGKYSTTAVAAGRPYGMGPYGTGRYGVGSGVNYNVGGSAQIAFSVVTQTAAIYATGGATGITLLPQAFAARIWSPAAATQVLFSTKWVGPQRVVTGAGTTQISFSVQGELVKTWQDATPCYVPCEPGTWGQEYPPWTERVAA